MYICQPQLCRLHRSFGVPIGKVNISGIPLPAKNVIAFKESTILFHHIIIFKKQFQIRAAIPIRKGEHISISYTDPMWGTANRQHHLYETKFFRCRCARCLDPTEMNTDFSSLRCPSCSIERPGYLTPSEPLDHTKSWQCDVCKKTEPANYVSAVIRSIGEELVCF